MVALAHLNIDGVLPCRVYLNGGVFTVSRRFFPFFFLPGTTYNSLLEENHDRYNFSAANLGLS